MGVEPRFDDPSRWEVLTARNVFDEHTDERKGKSVRRFTRADLDEIARRCNVRDRKGQCCPLTLGHTRDDAPEKDQPEIVGYARNFRVAYDERLGRHVIRADYYLRRDRAREAREYPNVSVEYWPDGRFFDPIALLRRTPQRDLGQWTYHRKQAGTAAVIRYAMGDKPVADEREDEREEDKGPAGPPDKDAPPPDEGRAEGDPDGEGDRREDEPERPGDPDVEPEFHQKVMKCIRGQYKHLDRMHEDYAKKYGAGAASQGNGFLPGDDDSDPDRSPPPDDDKPSDPESEGDMPPPPAKKPDQMARASDVLRMARLEAEVAELRAKTKVNERAQDDKDRLEALIAMEDMGYSFDRNEVMELTRRYSKQEFVNHLNFMRKTCKKDPASGPPLPVSPLSSTARYAAERTYQDESPDELAESDMDRFHDYLRRHPGAEFEAAKKYALEGRPKRFSLSRNGGR